MSKKYYNFVLFAYVWLLSQPAFAEFKKAQNLMEKIEGGLRGLSLVTVTIAVLFTYLVKTPSFSWERLQSLF